MGSITTHVLDTARGVPGMGIRVELFQLDGTRRLVTTTLTNERGRTPAPLLDTATFETGRYELVFHTAEYFERTAFPLTDPPFLDDIVLRVGAARDETYHIPLLVSPWSYAVYRGT